jgi:hypothetical protein
MGYELLRRKRECQQVNTKITKIRTSWDTNYHDGYGDEKESVRASSANRDSVVSALVPMGGLSANVNCPLWRVVSCRHNVVVTCVVPKPCGIDPGTHSWGFLQMRTAHCGMQCRGVTMLSLWSRACTVGYRPWCPGAAGAFQAASSHCTTRA